MLLTLTASTFVVFFFFLFPVTDYDIWWHMAGGRFMVENWQFPFNDTFSYTAEGKPWNPNSWGFTALSYVGYKALGLDGLNILKAVVATLIFAVIAGYLYWKKYLNYFVLTFLVLALFVMRGGFSLRPHTFAYLLFVIFLILLIEYKERRDYKLIAGLALTQFIWVNFHASFIFGLALGSILIMSEFIYNFIRTKKIIIRKKDVVLIMSLLISSLLHVFYGYQYLVRIIRDYFAPSAQIPIREALHATPQDLLSINGVLIILGLSVILYWGIRKRHFDTALAALFFAIIAVNTVRFMRDLLLFLVVTAPPYFFWATSSYEKMLHRKILRGTAYKRFKKNIQKVPSYAPRVAFFVFLFALFLIVKNTGNGIRLGVSPYSYPIKAVEFIQNEQLLEKSEGRLHHTYNFGGYLMWVNQPHQVAMDGRARPYLGSPFERYWLNFEGGEVWRDTQERYRVTVALMTLPHIAGGTVYNNSTPMFPKNEWALIYYDDIAMIYAKRIDAFIEVIEKYEYAILDPQATDFLYLQTHITGQEQYDAALEEIDRALTLNPGSYRLHFTRAYVYGLAGLQEEMVEELNRTLKINPQFQAAQNILEQLN